MQAIVRVGGRGKSSRLEPYNLKNMSNSAGGPEVAKCLNRRTALKAEVQEQLEQLRATRNAR